MKIIAYQLAHANKPTNKIEELHRQGFQPKFPLFTFMTKIKVLTYFTDAARVGIDKGRGSILVCTKQRKPQQMKTPLAKNTEN